MYAPAFPEPNIKLFIPRLRFEFAPVYGTYPADAWLPQPKAVFQLAELFTIEAPQPVPLDKAIPADGYTIESIVQLLLAERS